MYYVYLIKSRKYSEIYIGSTGDLPRRLFEHNKGREVSTKRYRPWELVYYEAYKSEEDAREREMRLKSHGNAVRELKKRTQKSLREHKNGAGFTLIELIIYIGIVAIILLVAFNFGWEIIYGNVKSRVVRETQQNARFAMERIAREIRKARAINTPGPGGSSNILSLEMADPNLDPTVFDVSDGKLRIAQGTLGPYELTNDRVIVSALQFTNLSYQGTPGTIQLDIVIGHANPAGRTEYVASVDLNSTISLVPGGAGLVEGGLCQGTPTACGNFGDQPSCENQGGCSWDPGSCVGTCTPCKSLGLFECLSQGGCEWNLRSLKCQGNCTSCDNYTDQGSCGGQLGCSWMSSFCLGTATSCEAYTTQTICISQEGCQWITP